jgi:hypothetical protein
MNKTPCRCTCGYTCGGPGKCLLPLSECLAQHFKKDCEHDFTGPVETAGFLGGSFSSVSCSKCGMLAISHDMRFGP